MIRKMMAGAIGAAAALCALSGPARAQTAIPIKIQWDGEQPTSISQLTDGGPRALDYREATRSFEGAIDVAGATPERRSLLLSYGGRNYRLDLRVSSALRSGISFVVQFRSARSCTSGNVQNVSKSTDNMPDALTAVLAAGQLLNIATPNDCDSALRRLAIQSRYMRSMQLGLLSGGLFLVPDEYKSDYRTAEVEFGRDAGRVDVQLAAYADLEQRMEAIQLATAQNAAINARDFGLASDINTAMIARVDSDPAIRVAYDRQGATRERLVRDAATIRMAIDR